ncbi:reverse transcriptase domain-containing protein [Tanacetum coccineum]
MLPKRTTTPITDVVIKAIIAQGVADALAEYKANRSSGNGDDSHDSGSGKRMTEHITRECMYSDFLKCQPLDFKCAGGVWNSHVKIVGHDVAYGMTSKTLMKMLTSKYYPRSEIKKLEIEIWNLKVNGTDVVEKYVGGLPDMIQGSVMASKPKTMQEAIEIANDLMDQKQNVARAYSAGPSEKKEYAGTLLLCNKCKFHHNGPCTIKCANCNRVGHLTRDCRIPAATNNQRTLTCYECGNQGHYRSDCSEIKNQNYGNQTRGTEARGMVYA